MCKFWVYEIDILFLTRILHVGCTTMAHRGTGDGMGIPTAPVLALLSVQVNQHACQQGASWLLQASLRQIISIEFHIHFGTRVSTDSSGCRDIAPKSEQGMQQCTCPLLACISIDLHRQKGQDRCCGDAHRWFHDAPSWYNLRENAN